MNEADARAARGDAQHLCASAALAERGRAHVFDVLQYGQPVRAFALRFEGQGADEKAYVDALTGDSALALQVGDCVVEVDSRYFRPAEVETLLGDATKARQKLGWVPEITAQQMCAEMVACDLKAAQRLALLRSHGHEVIVAREGRSVVLD